MVINILYNESCYFIAFDILYIVWKLSTSYTSSNNFSSHQSMEQLVYEDENFTINFGWSILKVW